MPSLLTIAEIGDYTFDRIVSDVGVSYQCSLTADIDESGDIRGATTTCAFLADGTTHLRHDGEAAAL